MLAQRESHIVETEISVNRAPNWKACPSCAAAVEFGVAHLRDAMFAQADFAAGRLQLAADAAQQRRLAATRPAHDGHHLAPRDLHIDPLEHRPAVVGEMQVFDIDQVVGGQNAV